MAKLTCIDSTPLLEKHDEETSQDSLNVILGVEAAGILGKLLNKGALLLGRQVGEVSCKDASLKDTLGLDLEELDLDKLVVLGQLSHPSHGLLGLFVPADLDKPSGRKGHEPDTNGKKDCGDSLDDGGQSPSKVGLGLAGSANEVATVSDPERKHDSENGGELIERNQQSSHLGSGKLSVVKGTDAAEEADTETGEESASI